MVSPDGASGRIWLLCQGSIILTVNPDIAMGPGCICGDSDGDGLDTISDAVYLISYVFAGGPPP